MTVPLQKILSKLPTDRQLRIRKQAERYIREYESLQDLRKTLGLTQTELAQKQGIRQVNISNLEKRTDMLISTLRKYVEAMGCELEINIRIPDQTVARIKDLD